MPAPKRQKKAMKVLFFGANGWIGGQFVAILKEGGHEIIPTGSVRADDEQGVKALLDEHKPSHVVCFIGRTHGGGINTIDYLEQPGKLVENVRDNLYSPVFLAMECVLRKINMVYLGTGCIFSADNPADSWYTEEAQPDFFGSSYSTVKGFTDRLMHSELLEKYVLNVRIRMPLVAELHKRNFITKIITYEKICSLHNSMTVLPDMLPLLMDMMVNKRTGTINLTNPGVISHNEILTMYRDIVDPKFTWKNFTIEEQNKILASKRSNNHLSDDKLKSWYPDVKGIHDAVRDLLTKLVADQKAAAASAPAAAAAQ